MYLKRETIKKKLWQTNKQVIYFSGKCNTIDYEGIYALSQL